MKPIALAFWGSFFRDRRHMTLGDVLSVLSIYNGLRRRGLEAKVLYQGESFPGPGASIVDPEVGHPQDFAAFVFVCGPLHAYGAGAAFFTLYQEIPCFALNVSQVSNSFDAEQYFNRIIWRDSAELTTFDTAIDPRVSFSWQSEPRSGISICLAADQAEYGDAGIQRTKAKTLVEKALQICEPVEANWISTVVDGRPLRDVEKPFARSTVVVTTRLHASLFSVRNRTPVIAIDQVKGGAKVSAIVGRQLGWPMTFSIDELTPETLAQAIETAKSIHILQMEWFQTKAEALSSAASDFMCDFVARALIESTQPITPALPS